MPKKIIYRADSDTAEFDIKRFITNLRKYGEVEEQAVNKALEEFEMYEPLHVSCLVEIGTRLLPEEAARRYFNEHQERFEKAPDFERLRRITGYLVGTLSRWNDAKKAEEAARVKHGLDGQYTQDEKAEIEAAKLENSVMSQF